MADYSDPKRGVSYRFTLSLFARSNNQIKTTPTLAAGDVKVSKDNGATANITTLPTEAPASSGILQVDLSATEMTADLVTVTFIDAAGAEWNDVAIHIAPTVRQLGDLAYPATSGRSMVVDANGLVDANMVKAGPTGSGTAITARDIGASVLLSSGTGTGQLDFTSGVVKANLAQILGTALTETAGQIAAGFKKLFDVAAPVFTLTSVNQTGDNYARLGAPAGASVSADVAAVKAVLPAALVGGRIDASVGAMAANTMTAAAAAADLTTELQAGLSTLDAAGVRAAVGLASANLDTQLGTIAGYIDTEVATILAAVDTEVAAIKAKTDNLPSDPADASDIAARFTTLDTAIDALPTNAELATALGTADDAVLAEIALVKAKTDSLTFTAAGKVDANITAVNSVLVDGAGTAGDPWGPV